VILASLALKLALALILPVLAASPAAAEQIGASRLALALVADSRNHPVVDIGPDDFVIQEANDAREILSVRVADYPIVVLLDTSVRARADFSQIRKSVARLVDRLGQRPIVIGTIGGVPKLISGFDEGDEHSSDHRELFERLDALEATGASDNQPLRGAALAAEALRQTGSLFSAIIIVTTSPVDPSAGPGEDLVGPIVDSGAIVHIITNRGTLGAVGAAGVGAGLKSNAILHSIVDQTHGEYTPIYSAASYQAAIDHLAERLVNELIVEYLVPVGSKAADVKIGVRLRGTHVRGLGVAPR
jgi:hypothetical protein